MIMVDAVEYFNSMRNKFRVTIAISLIIAFIFSVIACASIYFFHPDFAGPLNPTDNDFSAVAALLSCPRLFPWHASSSITNYPIHFLIPSVVLILVVRLLGKLLAKNERRTLYFITGMGFASFLWISHQFIEPTFCIAHGPSF
jgi:hypothetical protein